MIDRKRLPDYVTEFQDRHGKWRVRFRRKGQKSYYFRNPPWSDAFMQEYAACLAGEAAPKVEIGASRTKPGTLSALIVSYYAAPEFKGLKPSTQATYRGIIERFREKHGDKRVARIERKHIKTIIGAMHETPAAANNLLDRLKTLMRFAMDEELRKDDPTARVRGFKLDSDGFHTWSEEDIAAYQARHPVDTPARLAMAIMLYTGQRRSDAVKAEWQHVKDGRVSVRQQKTSKRLEIPMHPALREALENTKRTNMTFLVTSFNKPFTAAGFGNWFRDRCNEAGLPQCSAHGLRKAAARRLAEAGCTNQQIKAITGHTTDKEVSRYTAAAEQKKLADQAIAALQGAEREQKLSNQSDGLDKSDSK